MAKSPRQTVSIGPWPLGLQNTVSVYATPATALVRAEDVLIDEAGVLTSSTSAPSAYSVVGQSRPSDAYNSFYQWQGRTYGVVDGYLSTISSTGEVRRIKDNGSDIALTSAAFTPVDEGELFFTSYNISGRIAPDGLTATVLATETALSAEPTDLDNDDYSATSSSDGVTGGWAAATAREFAPTAYWNGRQLTAEGSRVYVSEPLDLRTIDRSFSYFDFASDIVFLCNVSTGIYVGTGDGVYFVTGNDVASWNCTLASPAVPVVGAPAAIVIPTAGIGISGVSGLAGAWFTEFGFTLGLQSGSVLYPQGDRLVGLAPTAGSMYFDGSRLSF